MLIYQSCANSRQHHQSLSVLSQSLSAICPLNLCTHWLSEKDVTVQARFSLKCFIKISVTHSTVANY